jgi:hypothetical protein
LLISDDVDLVVDGLCAVVVEDLAAQVAAGVQEDLLLLGDVVQAPPR